MMTSMNADRENILLVGDHDRSVRAALADAMPGAGVTTVAHWFDALAEAGSGGFSTVLANVEPIERRPDAAVRNLRNALGEGRIILFGHPSLEPLSRKMLAFGADDYLLIPADRDELRTVFRREAPRPHASPASGSVARALLDFPLAQASLDALSDSSRSAVRDLVRQLASTLAPAHQLSLDPVGTMPGDPQTIAQPVRSASAAVGTLMLRGPDTGVDARHALAEVASTLGKIASLAETVAGLQKLAVTDELTGVHNTRYFNHFLKSIVEKARINRFAVTLLLFDIDNFKQYNDRYGHAMGDQILKQTAALMRRCCRDHDLVARIGGDEFAVVFWEKDAPRVPRDPAHTSHSRVPQTPMIIAQRFQRLLHLSEFSALGKAGRGTLTISGGMAVYPFDAQTPESLVRAADEAQVFHAKRGGKNTIVLIGSGESLAGGEG
jgi:diguanylate cyclase (GGDEF)-like protein